MEETAFAVAIETLSWIEAGRMGTKYALARTLKQLNVHKIDAIGLAHKLVEETLRRQNVIDKLLAETIPSETLEKLPLGTRNFLRIYTYQNKYAGQRNIDSAFASITLARKILGWRDIHPIEPFLGRILSRDIHSLVRTKNLTETLSLSTFHETWFVDYCIKMLGNSEAKMLLQQNTDPSPTYLRINTLQGEEVELIKKLEEDNIELQKLSDYPNFFKLMRSKTPLIKTRSYRTGLFAIQDKSSGTAVQAASPREGMIVYDVCAGPGAKTGYLSQAMQNTGLILSMDISHRRLEILRSEMSRLGVKIVSAFVGDARRSLPIEGVADVVLVDPPCSNTGVFQKDPLAKWRLQQSSLRLFADKQARILEKSAEKVVRKGVRVYSTCSITIEENEEVIQRFLGAHSNFALEKPTVQGKPGLLGLTDCVRLYPHIENSNGSFIARLRKK
ncbi:MAG: RsmB/NOP family class I SAM-dependent RNA methyltransferase [Candidatus Bathyarchaeia archaeon]